MLCLISEEVAPITGCKYDFEAEGGRGGRSGCKTKHCWGLGGAGSVSKSGPESVYYDKAVQYSWSIHPPRDQEPGPTRVVGRPKGSYMFFLPKVEVGLISRNNGLSGPTGVVPTLGGLQ